MDDNLAGDGEELSPKLPPKTIILTEFNDRFTNAIKYISSQRVVGLSCEGVNLGRHGRICWVVIGCRHFTYLIDVVSLGDSCFDRGVAKILESGNVLKVTHDCRQMSDALFHQYSIKLVNVFDTQVADIIIYKNEKGGNLPRTVNGLVGCLYEYLNLSPEDCHFQKVRISNIQKDETIWSKRPLSQQLTDTIAKHVMYLRELRLAQMERMMAEFLFGVDIYLSVVRDGKDYQVTDKRRANKSRQVPQQFQQLYNFSHRQRTRKFDEGFAGDARQEDGKYDEPPPTHSAWLEGEGFTHTHRNKHGRLKECAMEPLQTWSDSQEGIPMGEPYGRGGYTETLTVTRAGGQIPTYWEESGESTEDSDNPFRLSSINVEETLTNDFSRNVNASQNLRSSNPPDVNNSGGAIGFEGFDLRGRHGQSVSSSSVLTRQSGAPPLTGPVVGSNISSANSVSPNDSRRNANDTHQVAIFNNGDFPPLSDSYSDNSYSSTPPRSLDRGYPTSAPPPGFIATTGDLEPDSRYRNHNSQENTLRSQSPLTAGFVGGRGRGRGSLFQRVSNTPQARLPHMDNAEPPWRNSPAPAVGGLHNRHAFPTDHELLASSEVTVVSDPSSVHGGTRVRVRKT